MARAATAKKSKPDQSIVEMTAEQARAFFLKPESYCTVDLPAYFTFARILSAVSKELHGKSLASMTSKPRDYEGVNYSMFSNKDGRHAWRPFQLINPALYVSLVEHMTQAASWKRIRDRFKEFQTLPNFQCLSIPLAAASGRGDKASAAITAVSLIPDS